MNNNAQVINKKGDTIYKAQMEWLELGSLWWSHIFGSLLQFLDLVSYAALSKSYGIIGGGKFGTEL